MEKVTIWHLRRRHVELVVLLSWHSWLTWLTWHSWLTWHPWLSRHSRLSTHSSLSWHSRLPGVSSLSIGRKLAGWILLLLTTWGRLLKSTHFLEEVIFLHIPAHLEVHNTKGLNFVRYF